MAIQSAASLIVLATLAYWSFFFGTELISTLRLYLEGDANYILLNATHQHYAEPNNTTDHRRGGAVVPLIMHRMWKDDSITKYGDNPDEDGLLLPANWTRSYAICDGLYRRRNWTTILWTDDRIRAFMVENYPDFVRTVYDSYPYDIQRVDAARYFILFHFGGVYADADIGCFKRKDLTDLIRSMEEDQEEVVAMVPRTRPVGLSNDVLFATKGSPFFRELMDTLPSKNGWYGMPYLTVLYSTGPMFLSLQYARLSSAQRRNILVIPPELYSQRGTRYFKHLRGSSWHRSDARAIKWLAGNWHVVAAALFLAPVFFTYIIKRHHPQKHENKRV